METERFSAYSREMKDDDFERCFFETVLEYGVKKYGRQKKFAAIVFPEMTEAVWRASFSSNIFSQRKDYLLFCID